MPMDKINFLENEELKKEELKKELAAPEEKNGLEVKSSKTKKFFSYLAIFIVVGWLVFSNAISVSDQSSFSWLNKLSLVSQLKRLAESADQPLKGEESDRINILLLGMGGKAHDGGYLTDTIILASLKPSTKKVALISIPRDLSVPLEGMGWRKINNVNAFAEAANPESGGQAVSQAVSAVFNIPIDYYFRVDFTGFTQVINELGGIKIYVDNTLDDYSYPILGREDALPYESRFEYLHIDQGWQTMNGELALKYARSRHAAGIEGSDFARARRQQKILEAVKDQLMSMHVLFKPRLITNIIEAYREHVDTDLKVWEMVKLWSLFGDLKGENITNKVLDNSPNGLLVDKIAEDGAYVLAPRTGNFSEIQYLINNVFSDAPVEIKNKVSSEAASLEIRNGTWINGLANRLALDLEKYGFKIIRIGNASQRNFQKSVIYDLTYGKKLESLTLLKEKTNANVSFELPQWLKDDISQSVAKEKDPVPPDFILVLGQGGDDAGE